MTMPYPDQWPNRIRAALNVLLGRPTMYRMRIIEMHLTLNQNEGAYLTGCVFGDASDRYGRLSELPKLLTEEHPYGTP